MIDRHNYAELARDLADVLMRYARERRDEDKKLIAELHGTLCRIRRAELAANDAGASPPSDSDPADKS